MRLITKSILLGVGTLALAGGATAAERAFHTLNVQLPDGSIEHINYIGDQPPEVRIMPVAASAPRLPVVLIDPADGFSFAAFDQVFRDMDARAAAMMRQTAMMARMPMTSPVTAPVTADAKADQAALKALPAGTVSYSFVSTTTSNGSCTRSVQTTSYGGKAEPKVVSRTTGDCSALSQPVKPTAAPGAVPGKAEPARPAAARTVSHDTA